MHFTFTKLKIGWSGDSYKYFKVPSSVMPGEENVNVGNFLSLSKGSSTLTNG